jgi:hypothetical protein
VDIVSDKKRIEIVNEWMDLAGRVAARTGDAEALQVISFFQQNVIIGRPGESLPQDGAKVIGVQNATWTEKSFSIVPLISGDESIAPVWKDHMEGAAGASFSPAGRVMVIKSHAQFSDLWKGMLLLHEGHHARSFLTKRYDYQDLHTYCEKERDTHAFQNRVISRLGGDPYYDVLAAEVAFIEEANRLEGSKPPAGWLPHGSGKHTLDSVFGPPLSLEEQSVRAAHFVIHAHFELIDRHNKVDPSEMKTAFMNCMYSTHR